MSNGFVKMRGGVSNTGGGGGSFSSQVNSRSQTSQRRQRPDGEFDRIYPVEVSTWFRICPTQSWEYVIFNKEANQLETVRTPWFEYVSHYYPARKRSTICSGGPGRDKPCYADAIRAAFYDEKRRREESTGIREEAYAPLSASTQFALSCTVVERIFAVQKRNADGTPRLSKARRPIYDHVPESRYSLQPGEQTPASQFGRNMHWSMGIHHLKELQSFDEMLRNKNARTGLDLLCIGTECPDCGSALHDFSSAPLVNEDLANLRSANFTCPRCSYSGNVIPKLASDDGGPVQEGGITAFDLRLKAVPIDDKKKTIQLVGLRMPAQPNNTELQKLINTPLSLPDIFAPTDLSEQQQILGDLTRGIDPRGGILASRYNNEENENGEITF